MGLRVKLFAFSEHGILILPSIVKFSRYLPCTIIISIDSGNVYDKCLLQLNVYKQVDINRNETLLERGNDNEELFQR